MLAVEALSDYANQFAGPGSVPESKSRTAADVLVDYLGE